MYIYLCLLNICSYLGWCMLAEQFYMSQLAEREKAKDQVAAANEMKGALEKQMESQRKQYHHQLTKLREEISVKQTRIKKLIEYVPTLSRYRYGLSA